MRLLGINQFRIYNKTKEKDNGFLSYFFQLINYYLGLTTIFSSLFTGNTTKNPERLIESIKEINFIKGNQKQFYLECFEENNKIKKLLFETKTAAMASYIYAKITFLM